MSRFTKASLASAALLLLLLKLFSDLYLAASDGLGANLANDAINLVWPFYNYARASIASGELPLWNPYSAVGAPFIADIVLGMLYPINWIIFALEVPYALLVIQFLTVMIGMAGMYCYTRYLELAWPARVLCVVLFAYCVFTEAFHPALGSSFCWFPMLLWLTHRFLDSPGYVGALWIGVVLALCFLAGFPNFFLYTCMLLFVYGVVVLAGAWPRLGFKGALSRVAVLAPALVLMLGLVAVQLLPAYELSTFSVRTVQSGTAFQSESAWENFSLVAMIQNYFLADSARLYAVEAIEIRSGIYYMGGALLLLPFSLSSRRFRLASTALVASLVFIVLFMMSNQVPALSFLQKIPLADSLRVHGRATAYAQALLIVLAGIGLSALCERVRHTGRMRALVSAALFVAYAVLLGVFALGIQDSRWFVFGFALCALVIAIVLLQPAVSSKTLRYCWVIALVIIVDVSAHRSNRFLVPAFVRAEGGFVASNLPRARTGTDHYRVLFVPRDEGMAYELANIGSKYQVPAISAYSSLTLARWEHFIRYLAGEQEFDRIMSHSINARFYGAFIPSLQRLLAKEPGILQLASLRYWFSGKGTREDENALPRAYLVRHYIQADDEAGSLAAIKANMASLGNTVVLENASPSFSPAPAPADGQRGDVVIKHYSAHRVELEVDAAEPSIVVLTDAFYPGWEAFVDGKATPVLRANSLFRAVEVAPGMHRVDFRFRSASLFWGSVISLVSVGLVVALFVRLRSRPGLPRDDNLATLSHTVSKAL